MEKKFGVSCHQADRFIIRFPDGMRDRIKEQARANRRSMNDEILFSIESNAIPSYAADLLVQAKAVMAASMETLPLCLKNLETAVIGFERQMPVKNGNVLICNHRKEIQQ